MAEQDKSIIYQLILDLKGDESLDALRNRLQFLADTTSDVDDELTAVQLALDALSPDGVKQLAEHFQAGEMSLSGLRDMFSQLASEGKGGSETAKLYAEAVRELDAALDRANAAQDESAKSANNLEEAYTQASNQVADSGNKVQQTQVKNTQATQSLIQIINDAQFGMIGIQNNIQQLGLQLAREMNRGVSATQFFKQSITALATGPLAIPALVGGITLLISTSDTWLGWLREIGAELGIVARESERANRRVQTLNDAFQDIIKGLEDSPLGGQVLQGLRDIQEQARLLEERRQEALLTRAEEISGTEAFQEANQALQQATAETEAFESVIGPLNTALENADISLNEVATAYERYIDNTRAAVQLSNDLNGFFVNFQQVTGQAQQRIETFLTEYELVEGHSRENASAMESFTEKVEEGMKFVARGNSVQEIHNDLVRRGVMAMQSLAQQQDATQAEIDATTNRLQLLAQAFQQVEESSEGGGQAIELAASRIRELQEEINVGRVGDAIQSVELEFEKRREAVIEEFANQADLRERHLEMLAVLERQRRMELVEEIERDAADLRRNIRSETAGEYRQLVVQNQNQLHDRLDEIERLRIQQRQVAAQEYEGEALESRFQSIDYNAQQLERRAAQSAKQRGEEINEQFMFTPLGVPQRKTVVMQQINEDFGALRTRLMQEADQLAHDTAMAAPDVSVLDQVLGTGGNMMEAMEHELSQVGVQISRQRAAIQAEIDKQDDILQTFGVDSEQAQAARAEMVRLQQELTNLEEEGEEKREDIRKKYKAQRISMIKDMGMQLLSNAEEVASGMFETWQSERDAELKAEGKTAEERQKILEEEGQRRFKLMKAMRIAEATAAGLTATIEAFRAGTSVGNGPAALALGTAMAATAAATTAMQIKKIASLKIGDTVDVGTGGAGGGPTGQFTQLSGSAVARRAGEISQSQQQQRNMDAGKLVEDTAKRVGEEVARNMPNSVTLDERTAENAQNVATKRSKRLNK